MTESNPHALPEAPAAAGTPQSAGALLRAAREARGLTQDAVAQQLKLAPRQVTALEEDDFARLPGPTFVRGFLRNYARLLHIDPDPILSALRRGEAAALDSPMLQPTAPTMGELPRKDRARPGWTRWAIPLALIAVVVTAAIHEFSRGQVEGFRLPALLRDMVAPKTAAPPAPSPAAGPTALPNPLGTATPASEAQGEAQPGVPEANAPGAAPAVETAPPPASAEPAAAASVSPAAPATTPAPPAAAEATLVLTYHDKSWTEVKDAHGAILLSQMVAGGQTRTISGEPPFDIVIGNASEVSATFRGQPVDLAAVTQKNVARFSLE
jgi:cytoskeleton protein RodZ